MPFLDAVRVPCVSFDELFPFIITCLLRLRNLASLGLRDRFSNKCIERIFKERDSIPVRLRFWINFNRHARSLVLFIPIITGFLFLLPWLVKSAIRCCSCGVSALTTRTCREVRTPSLTTPLVKLESISSQVALSIIRAHSCADKKPLTMNMGAPDGVTCTHCKPGKARFTIVPYEKLTCDNGKL